MILYYLFGAVILVCIVLFIYQIRQEQLFRIFLKNFEYEDEIIKNCIKDYWGLCAIIHECDSKHDLIHIWKREIDNFENAYYNLVPDDLLDLHLERLNDLYVEKFHKLA